MKISQAFICLLLVSLALSQPTFPTTPTSSGSTVSTNTVGSGTLITFTGAGWIISSDYITAATAVSTTSSFVVTPLQAASSTSIGLIGTSGNFVVGGSSLGSAACAAVSTTYNGKTNLEGNGQSNTCPADFVSLYTATPATTSTTTSTNLVFSATGNARLIVGLPTTVTITTAAAANGCHQVTYQTATLGAVSALATTGTCPTSTPTDNANALKYVTASTPTYAFYANAEGKAAVCVQSSANFLTSPGCGYLSNKFSSSGSILSVLVAPLVVISAILFN